MRATLPSRALGGLGSSRPHVSRPALSRAAGRYTVRRHHRTHRYERHAPPPQSVRRPHAGRSASRPRTTSTGSLIADGETALQLTQRRGAAAQARSFIAWRCATERGQESARAPALATPGRAAQPTPVGLTRPRRVSAGVANRETTFPRPPARSGRTSLRRRRRAANSAARTDRQGPCLRT
jgi:hypothetical protein